MTPEEVRQIIREELKELIGMNGFIFQKGIQMMDGRNIQTGRTLGTIIGGAYDQKVGFYTIADKQFPYSRGNNTGITGAYAIGSGAAAKVDTAYLGTNADSSDATDKGYTVGDIVTALKFIGILAKTS